MKSSFGFGILGLPCLLMVLVTINVAEAHATNVTSSLTVGFNVEIEPLGAKSEKHLVLLSTSGANAVQILCGKVEVTTAVLEAEGKGTGSVSTSECSTAINEKSSAECKPLSQPVKVSGSVKVIKHEGVTYLKAEGTSGLFATFKFECVQLPETVKVTGIAWIKEAGNEWEVEKATHLVEEGKVPASALGGLFFGANKATIDGSANVSFSDVEHKGRSFSGLAANEGKEAAWMVEP